MKNLINKFPIVLLVVLTACGPQAAPENDTTAEETGETAKQEQPAATTLSGEGFTIKVLEGGIASPRKEMKGTAGGAAITINYGSPSVKGRTIGEELAPFGEVWRTGANAATTFETAQAIMVEGKALPAGKYGLFTIPGKDSWTVIFNKVSDQWGAGNYDAGQDALRAKVTPKTDASFQETMDFMVDGDAVVLRWGSWAVPFKVAAQG